MNDVRDCFALFQKPYISVTSESHVEDCTNTHEITDLRL